jgi:acyl carrier protein phosphodiesterase
MQRTDLLAAYRDVAVLARACDRIGERLRMPDLGPRAAAAIERDYDGLADDFRDYYPALQRHVTDWLAAEDTGKDTGNRP